MSDVDQFISRFHCEESVTGVFENGCCYWFAAILKSRFGDRCSLVYDEVKNHFGAQIDGRVYDVTGDVTDKYNWISWFALIEADPTHAARIVKDCVFFS